MARSLYPKPYKQGEVYYSKKRHKGKIFFKCLETTDRRVAEKRSRQWVDELAATNWGETPPKTLQEASLKFAATHFKVVKLKTAERYKTSLHSLIPMLGEIHLPKLDSSHLHDYEMSRRDEGVTPKTIINDLRCLSKLLQLAQKVWKWQAQNIVPDYFEERGKALQAAEPRSRYLSHEEEAKILAVCPPRFAQLVIFAIETGLRREEMMSLLLSDINWQQRTIHVRAEVSKSFSRHIPLTQRAGEAARFLKHPSSIFVCPKEDGTRYSPTSPHWIENIHKYAKRAKIEDLVWHDLRRTTGCRLLQDRRMSMEAVSKWLGHSNVAITQKVYAFLNVDKLKEMMDETQDRVVSINSIRGI